MFPFLIGTVRTPRRSWSYSLSAAFPFLIGTVRTTGQFVIIKLDTHVSIPHRYGKNYEIRCKTLGLLVVFPFLIGTVRTQKYALRLNLKYVSIPHRYGKNHQLVRYVSPAQTHVSIPHRYGKNYAFLLYTIQYVVVSIPHRYGKNFDFLFIGWYRGSSFPFLIGTVRTSCARKTRTTVSSFHSS